MSKMRKQIDVVQLQTLLGSGYVIEPSGNFSYLVRTEDTVFVVKDGITESELMLFDDDTYGVDYFDSEKESFNDLPEYFTTLEKAVDHIKNMDDEEY